MDNEGDYFDVLLGFAETVAPEDKNKLHPKHFPSKVGGKPAWLNPRDLPPISSFTCDHCSLPLSFILQVYAHSDDHPHAFHRSIFLFACQQPSCQSVGGSVKVYRDQMPRRNQFYSYHPLKMTDPVELPDDTYKALAKPLCVLCGLPSVLTCSHCPELHYCSKAHQIIHWRQEHAEKCGASAEEAGVTEEDLVRYPPNLTFSPLPEYEIDIQEDYEDDQDEDEDEDEDDEDDEGITAEHVRELETKYYEEMKQAGTTLSKEDDQLESDLLEDLVQKFQGARLATDPQFSRFQKKTKHFPKQILRYCRDEGYEPLWVSDQGMLPSADIPPCPACGGPRSFEFQVMPQLLNHLQSDDFDFGTLVVYTCKNDCAFTSGAAYLPEFVHRQAMR